MKIVIATCGTRGDIQPLIALARALARRGHQALIAAPPEHGDWVENCGCPFQALGSDFTEMLKRYPQVHTLRPMMSFLGILRREIRKQLTRLPGIIEGADLVLGASLCCGLRTAAELKGIPYGYVAMAPQILPSSHHPFVALKSQNLPPRLNRLSWQLARLLDRMNFTALINKERRRLNLAPVKDILGHILGCHVIVASDPVLAGVPSDVELDTIQTGYMHLQTDQGMPGRLEKFLAAGPAPIYFGFGSMSTRGQEAIVALIQTSLELTGQRGILSGFRFDAAGLGDSHNCHFVDAVPHPLLFPRLAAVVHHGGSGTTATAALAGVPQIIVPHILDQYYWGQRVSRCGLGPKPIRRSRLTAERLAAAINECVCGPGYYDRASAIAGEIEKQDSLGLAADYLEKTYFNA
ncbi:MAG: glycosyltransferase [Desulfobacteraceae bacterium]|jgi:UDP:flavonoid glycosyltransferase YjiC (YdhE family)|nr:glycosyltransferase [Desulfobacteraceae bacterium]